jgi:hypothetical protein
MMALRIDFNKLEAAVRRMGAEPIPFETGVALPPVDPIDLELNEGIELADLNLVSSQDGLLSYEGRQILLYIQDHGSRIDDALSDPSAHGRRFHVADCRTLHQMRDQGRFDRYRITNNLGGQFFITGASWSTGKHQEGYAALDVCQNCLKHLNYKGASHGHARHLVHSFDLREFFSTYASFFKYLPALEAGRAEDDAYSKDWPVVSGRHKADLDFTCEACGVELSAHKGLLHVHHKNGVKGDNRPGNLEVLCASCHREKPAHGHLFVSHADTQLINRLRGAQNLLDDAEWKDAIEFADPGLRGVLDLSQRRGASVPQVGLDLLDSYGAVCTTLELAWDAPGVGVAIGEDDIRGARELGWEVWKMVDVISDPDGFVARLHRRRPKQRATR